MKFSALRSKPRKIAAFFTFAIIGWMLLVYIADWPITLNVVHSCAICRASKACITYFMVPVSVKVENCEFSRYYIRYSDPMHKHIWRFGGMSRKTRTSEVSAHGGPNPRLPYEAALAILKSLPKGQTQKAFFERIYVPDDSAPEAHRIEDAIWKLNEAYWEDEHRKDWAKQLRRVDLYPKVSLSK